MAKLFKMNHSTSAQTAQGKLQGYFYDGVYIFKGIPYAKAKRFRMPEKVPAWEGIKDACSYGPVCPLINPDKPTGELMVPHRYWPSDEDCLNLNVWTNALDAQAKKPVIVWFHGGGYSMGSAIEQEAYDGANMAAHGDVVVITVNHRLNLLGLLDLSSYGEEYKYSGSLHLADLVASLEWVKENIASFGGDPENVTIWGQSGGGMKVTGLMQIPAADGLFHKAFVMSGVSDGSLIPAPRGDCSALAEAMANALAEGDKNDTVKVLEEASYHDLAAAYNKVFMQIAMTGGNVAMSPSTNAYYLGEPLIAGSMTDNAKKIPMMVGTTIGEFAFAPTPYDKAALTKEESVAIIEKVYGEHTAKAIELFKKAFPDKHETDLLSLDRAFRAPSKALAKMHSEGGAGTYLYEFTLNFDIHNQKPAWHCSDIPFFFRNTDKVQSANMIGVSDELEKTMFDALIRFVQTGSPQGGDLPDWKPVSGDKEPTQILDRECRVVDHLDDELIALMEKALPKFNMMAMMKEDVQH